MTKEEAMEKFDTGWWEKASNREIVAFQLYEKRSCMPFGEFHEAVERVLGRPVFIHEFAHPTSLKEEFEGLVP